MATRPNVQTSLRVHKKDDPKLIDAVDKLLVYLGVLAFLVGPAAADFSNDHSKERDC